MTAAFVVASVPRAASAMAPTEIPLRISESIHPSCPERPEVRERLEAHLGSIRAPEEGEPAIDLAIDVAKRDGLSVGTLTLTAAGASVQRVASSTSCEDVLAALTVMAVIAIGEQAEHFSPQPTAPSDRAAAPPPGEPRAPGQTSSGRSNARLEQTVRARRSSRALPSKRLTVALGSGVDVNVNRGAVLLGTWFAEVTFPVRLDPTLRVGFARSTRERASVAPGAVALRWVELIWAMCVDAYRDPGFRAGPCLNGELGSLQASVIRPLPARDIPSPWFSIGASARASWRIVPPFSVEMMAGARAPIPRRELFFEPFDDVLAYRAPVISPFVEIGFVAHLP